MVEHNNPQQARAIRIPIPRTGSISIVVGILLVGALLAYFLLLPKGDRINTSGYQVVYMTSGQAYFGKLRNASGEYLILDNPYTAQNVTPEGESQPSDKQSSTTLLKVSQQQYGPEDVLSLKSEQVLFWQNLRNDSKVTEAIKNAK